MHTDEHGLKIIKQTSRIRDSLYFKNKVCDAIVSLPE
jgi:hypothetical protein